MGEQGVDLLRPTTNRRHYIMDLFVHFIPPFWFLKTIIRKSQNIGNR